MATLDEAGRAAAHGDFEEDVFNIDRQPCALSRAEIRAAVNAIDDYLEVNAASMNQALPLAARSSLTAGQKARLLIYVVRRRYLAEA